MQVEDQVINLWSMVFFIAATKDSMFSAFDKKNGQIIVGNFLPQVLLRPVSIP
jgi:hypothetical protein